MMVRRDLLEQLNGFDEEMVVAEDTDLIFRLGLKTRFCVVAAPLVSIDRTLSRSGRMVTFSGRNESRSVCFRHMYSKWLALPDLVDAGKRQLIREHLRLSYYSSSISSLNALQFAGAFRHIRRIRGMGDSYATIFAVLLFRAVNKVFRTLTLGRLRMA